MKLISALVRSRRKRNAPCQGVTAAAVEMEEFSVVPPGKRVAVGEKKEEEGAKNGLVTHHPAPPRDRLSTDILMGIPDIVHIVLIQDVATPRRVRQTRS
jgi:hypothetical protein